jgi:hypothetical protein
VKKWQLFDLLRRVSEMTNISEPVIVGSHSLFAITDLVPSIVDRSVEADFLLGPYSIEMMRKVNDELGVTSDFYHAHGYYADGLGLATVVLVQGWQDRLQPLKDESGQVVAQCLEVHDVAVSKMMAGRDKDMIFLSALLDGNLISLPTLAERAALIQQTASEGALLPRLEKFFNHLRSQGSAHDLAPLVSLINQLKS